MSDNASILSYAAAKFGGNSANTAEMAAPAQPVTEPATPAPAEMAETKITGENNNTIPVQETAPVTTPEPPTEQEPPADPLSFLDNKEEEKREFTPEDLQKLKDYETLQEKIAELEKSKVNFANPWVQTLNELILSGKDKEAVNQYIKLNQAGDLNTLDPIDIKVSKLVLKDGYSEKAARALVNRDFDIQGAIAEYGEDSDEVSLMKEQLRVSSKSDLKELESYKKELTTIDNEESQQQEQLRLQQEAYQAQFEKQLESDLPKIAAAFPSTFKTKVKLGEEELEIDYKYSKEYTDKVLPTYLKNFLLSEGTLTREGVIESFGFGKGAYWEKEESLHEYAKIIADKVASKVWEQAVAKYSNLSGLPKQEQHPNPKDNELVAQKQAFYQKLVGRKN